MNKFIDSLQTTQKARKTAMIQIRVDEETERLIYDASKRYHIKPSEYIRRMVVTRLNRRFTWDLEIVEERKKSNRKKIFHVRVDEDTKKKLVEKCKRLDISESDYIGFIISYRLEMYKEHRKRDIIYENERVPEVSITNNQSKLNSN